MLLFLCHVHRSARQVSSRFHHTWATDYPRIKEHNYILLQNRTRGAFRNFKALHTEIITTTALRISPAKYSLTWFLPCLDYKGLPAKLCKHHIWKKKKHPTKTITKTNSWPTAMPLQSPTTNSCAKTKESFCQCLPQCSCRTATVPRKTVGSFSWSISNCFLILHQHHSPTNTDDGGTASNTEVLSPGIRIPSHSLSGNWYIQSHCDTSTTETFLFPPSVSTRPDKSQVLQQNTWEGLCTNVYFAFTQMRACKQLTAWKDIHFCD